MRKFYPLLMDAFVRDALWGGTRIASFFGRDIPLPRCAETWEISSRPEGPSRVANGPLAGRPLAEALKAFGIDSPFPLLFKLIDANDTLSVQVHPDDASAARHGGEAKTEMWTILHAEPDAALYVGLREGVDRARLLEALEAGRLQDCLNRIPVQAGDAVLIPGGTVHAIGAGCLLYEVQQNSDTTYRLFDWNRKDDQGRPRPLHVEQALAVIDWDQGAPEIARPNTGDDPCIPILHHRYFRMDRQRIAPGEALRLDPGADAFLAIFVVNGAVEIEGGGEQVTVPRGRSALLPGGAASGRALNDRPAEVLLTRF